MKTTKALSPGAVGQAEETANLELATQTGVTIFMTGLSAAAAAVGNVGPGLRETIGPNGTYSGLPNGAKWALSFAMLLGRLELFTVLVLLRPEFWRR